MWRSSDERESGSWTVECHSEGQCEGVVRGAVVVRLAGCGERVCEQLEVSEVAMATAMIVTSVQVVRYSTATRRVG